MSAPTSPHAIDVPALAVPVAAVELGVVRADRPAQLVQVATEAATALAEVIEQQKLYSVIQGKKFVRCEGWTTLAAMLGVTPHEIGVTEADGVFTATVELRRLGDGQPVARASAECGAPDEVNRDGTPIWANRPRYARRSMALTRATAKACRLAFSWIMALSGYEVTPAEEIPHEAGQRPAAGASASGPSGPVSRTPQPLSEKPAALTEPEPPAPWDEVSSPPQTASQSAGPVMPFGTKLKGVPLRDCPSDALLAAKLWAEKKAPEKFARFIAEAEAELSGRAGE
ncbi:MAG TPA: hypothetical protein VNL18_15630 [Gemmatimonadales bacterium]|nr:hypothetical protein [Gemmatimonadales bacterium]